MSLEIEAILKRLGIPQSAIVLRISDYKESNPNITLSEEKILTCAMSSLCFLVNELSVCGATITWTGKIETANTSISENVLRARVKISLEKGSLECTEEEAYLATRKRLDVYCYRLSRCGAVIFWNQSNAVQ